MSNNRNTLSAQVREDSALYEGFQEYQERHGFESKSEAVRAALRQGVETDRAGGPTEAESAAASRSTLTAVALYAVAELAAFPTAARYTLFGAAFVFAAASVVGYGRVLRDIVGEKLELGDVDELDDEGAVASISPLVRVVGGALMLLALAFTAVSGVL